MKSLTESLPHTGEGIVIDIGTGDGRFVSAAAKENPNKFFIGVDANVKALEKPSIRATRKPTKGGLPNAMFVQAAVEDLPIEFDGIADEIHIHFPWGSLLRAAAGGDAELLSSLRRIAGDGCLLEIIIGMDPDRDRAELERLEVPVLTPVIIHTFVVPKYLAAGFELLEARQLRREEWAAIRTTWAQKLRFGSGRTVHYLLFRADAQD
ncbi:MAG: methyltransferase domain-containing protein [Chloracidobacterium sp.]|nr:methyltransferase domain-containing protein [Chloracidobacterium sp.]